MSTYLQVTQQGTTGYHVGELVEIAADGTPFVRLPETGGGIVAAEVLHHHPMPVAGQRVLIISISGQYVILGAILPRYPDSDGLEGAAMKLRQPGDKRLHLEATEEITMRCGKSSLTLEKSGRVLIKGADIVSRASRNNRIKGSSVAIN